MRRRRCHSDDQTGSRHDVVVRPKHPSPEPVELLAQATDVWLGCMRRRMFWAVAHGDRSSFSGLSMYIFDVAALDQRRDLVVRHRIPHSTLDLSEEERTAGYGPENP